jgi:hypothetical protein
MTVRRVLAVAIVLLGTYLGLAPSASAKPGACAWVDPYGVCISNPVPSVPKLPALPTVPKL